MNRWYKLGFGAIVLRGLVGIGTTLTQALLRALVFLAVALLALKPGSKLRQVLETLPDVHAHGPAENPWLNMPDIFYDPANISGVASDTNSCIDRTHPCLTWNQLLIRFGGPFPIVPSVGINIHLMSTNVGHDLPLNFLPFGPQAVLISLVGDLQQVGSPCTLTAVTDRNTAPSVGTQTAITASCPTAPGQFIINTTHPSAAWTKSFSAGSGVVTQPLTRCDTTTNTCPRTEVNNWTAGDSITANTFLNVAVDVFGPINAAQGSGTVGFSHVCFDGGAQFLVGVFQTVWEDCQAPASSVEVKSSDGEFLNYYMPSDAGTSFKWQAANVAGQVLFKGLVPAVYGGILHAGADVEGSNFGLGADLENNVTVSGVFQDVYLGHDGSNGEAINLAPSDENRIEPTGGLASSGIIWGPGAFNILQGATLAYFPGSATSVFLNGQVAAGGRGFVAWPGTARRTGVTQALWCATNTVAANPVPTDCGILGTAANLEGSFGSGGCAGACFVSGLNVGLGAIQYQ